MGYDKRHCPRCKAETLGGVNRPDHLCADIAKRLARRERQAEAVEALIFDYCPDPEAMDATTRRELAEEIVRKLANLNVTED